MSNSAGIALTAEPLPPSRAVVPRPASLPRAPTAESLVQRQGRQARFQARPEQRHTDGSAAGKRPAVQSPPAAGQQRAPRLTQSASAGFLAQVLAQTADGKSEGPLQRHRDGPGLGSSAYRRAGGEPPIYPEVATFVRLTA